MSHGLCYAPSWGPGSFAAPWSSPRGPFIPYCTARVLQPLDKTSTTHSCSGFALSAEEQAALLPRNEVTSPKSFTAAEILIWAMWQ